MIVIEIAGHLGQDPETRFTPTNKKVISLRVATNLKRGNKEKTIWWKVTIWGDRFDQKLQYLKKGSGVIVRGEMGIPDIYTDKEGNPQTSFEIIADSIIFNPFGGKSKDDGHGDNQGETSSERRSSSYGMGDQSAHADSHSLRKPGITHGTSQYSNSSFDADDDIPF
ncbi:MAG: single-stranded DNA-binding protein [Chlamydia sp.]